MLSRNFIQVQNEKNKSSKIQFDYEEDDRTSFQIIDLLSNHYDDVQVNVQKRDLPLFEEFLKDGIHNSVFHSEQIDENENEYIFNIKRNKHFFLLLKENGMFKKDKPINNDRNFNQKENFHTIYKNTRIAIVFGDLTDENVDAIINTTDEQIQLLGRISGAIKKVGGSTIQEQCQQWIEQNVQLEDFQTMTINAGKLPCTYLIYTKEIQELDQLEQSVFEILKRVNNLRCISVSIPILADKGMALDHQADIFIRSIFKYIDSGQNFIKHIRLTNPDEKICTFLQHHLQNFYQFQNEQ